MTLTTQTTSGPIYLTTTHSAYTSTNQNHSSCDEQTGRAQCSCAPFHAMLLPRSYSLTVWDSYGWFFGVLFQPPNPLHSLEDGHCKAGLEHASLPTLGLPGCGKSWEESFLAAMAKLAATSHHIMRYIIYTHCDITCIGMTGYSAALAVTALSTSSSEYVVLKYHLSRTHTHAHTHTNITCNCFINFQLRICSAEIPFVQDTHTRTHQYYV